MMRLGTRFLWRISLMLMAQGCIFPALGQGLAEQSPSQICGMALGATGKEWSQQYYVSPYVVEAQRRGYSTAYCRSQMTPSDLERMARLEPTSPQPAVVPPVRPPPDPLIASIQILLPALGFDAGPPDGLVGPKTTAAIADFQRSIGEDADGKPSEALKARMQTTVANRGSRALSELTRRQAPIPPSETTVGEIIVPPLWKTDRAIDKLTGKPFAVVSARSNDSVKLPSGEMTEGELVFRCRDNTTAMFVLFKTPVSQHYTSISYRIDMRPVATASWQSGTAMGAVGLFNGRSAIPFIKSLIGAHTMVIRAQPNNAAEATLTFGLDGLGEVVGPVRDLCEWDGPKKISAEQFGRRDVDPTYLSGPQPVPRYVPRRYPFR